MQTNKKYINIDPIKPLKTGMGGSLITDRIVVEGKPINYMYRQKPDNDIDSGWRFFSGFKEDDAYINNPDNTSVFDVNTVANYDQSILPFLDASVGSVFERERATGKWKQVFDYPLPD